MQVAGNINTSASRPAPSAARRGGSWPPPSPHRRAYLPSHPLPPLPSPALTKAGVESSQHHTWGLRATLSLGKSQVKEEAGVKQAPYVHGSKLWAPSSFSWGTGAPGSGSSPAGKPLASPWQWLSIPSCQEPPAARRKEKHLRREGEQKDKIRKRNKRRKRSG